MGFDYQLGRAVASGAASGAGAAATPGKQTLTQNLTPGPAPAPTKRHLTSAPPAVRSPGLDDAGALRDFRQAEEALYALHVIFMRHDAREIDVSCGPYEVPLRQLYQALTGNAAGRPLSYSARRDLFEAGTRGIQPAIELVRSDPDGSVWVANNVYPSWFDSSYPFSAAKERVEHAIVVGDHTVDVPPDDAPREQGRALHEPIAKLVSTMRVLDEQLIHMNEHAIEHEIEALLEHGGAHGGRTSRLADLADVLMLVDAWLALTDDELLRRLARIHNIFAGVATYAELVKSIVELTGGAVGVTAKAVAIVAKATGQAGIAATAAGLAGRIGVTFGDLVTGVEVVVGIAEILDPDTTPGEKLEAGVHVAAGAGWLVGKEMVGAGSAFSMTVPVLLGYEEWKWAVETYWESAVGIDSFLIGDAFEKLTSLGWKIAHSSEILVKSLLVERDEQDSSARATLHRVTEHATSDVTDDLVSLLDACIPPDLQEDGGGPARKPGAWSIFRELFAPLRGYRHAATAALAIEGATLALRKLVWANRHPQLIIEGSVRNDSLETVEDDARKIDLLDDLEHGE